MTVSLDNGAADLGHRHPEWLPWLTVIEQVLREATDTKWQRRVPPEGAQSRAPLLRDRARSRSGRGRWVVAPAIARCLRERRAKNPTYGSKRARLNTMDLFIALHSGRIGSICGRPQSICGMEADALQAVAALVPLPLLHACQPPLAAIDNASWMEGYCPVCGPGRPSPRSAASSAAAIFRCGRCGGGWQAQCLFCPYCA